MSGFYILISTKKNINLNFQNNKLIATHLTCKLGKMGNDKIIYTIENIVLNWLFRVSLRHLDNNFISHAFSRIFVIIPVKNIT